MNGEPSAAELRNTIKMLEEEISIDFHTPMGGTGGMDAFAVVERLPRAVARSDQKAPRLVQRNTGCCCEIATLGAEAIERYEAEVTQ